MTRPSSPHAWIAAAAVGAALPTAVPGLAFALDTLDAATPWRDTFMFEAGLALAGALTGALAVVTHRRGALAITPLVPVIGAIAVAIAAAAHVEEVGTALHGTGPGPVLVWIVSVVGGAAGVILQAALAVAVWGVGVAIARSTARDPESALGVGLAVAAASLHVAAKLLFTPLVFGIVGAALALVAAALARRIPRSREPATPAEARDLGGTSERGAPAVGSKTPWRLLAVLLAALTLVIGGSAELFWLSVEEEEAYHASLPPCADAPYLDPPLVGEYTRTLESDPGVLRAGTVSDAEQRGGGMVYAQRAFVVPAEGTTADPAFLARLTSALRARECEPAPSAEPVVIALAPEVPTDVTVRAALDAPSDALRARIEAMVRDAFTLRRDGIGLCGAAAVRPADEALRPADVAFRSYDVEVRFDGNTDCFVSGAVPRVRTVTVELRGPS